MEKIKILPICLGAVFLFSCQGQAPDISSESLSGIAPFSSEQAGPGQPGSEVEDGYNVLEQDDYFDQGSLKEACLRFRNRRRYYLVLTRQEEGYMNAYSLLGLYYVRDQHAPIDIVSVSSSFGPSSDWPSGEASCKSDGFDSLGEIEFLPKSSSEIRVCCGDETVASIKRGQYGSDVPFLDYVKLHYSVVDLGE